MPGATTVTLEQAEALYRTGTVLFIDVMKVPRGESAGLEGKWLVAKPHVAIKGSTWLPETGEGILKPEIERYFRANLERLTDGNPGTPALLLRHGLLDVLERRQAGAVLGLYPDLLVP